MSDTDLLVTGLHRVLQRSPYFYYVMRHVRQIGFKVGEQVILMEMSFETGNIRFSAAPDTEGANPELWASLDEHDLANPESNEAPIAVEVMRSPSGSHLPPALEELVSLCFGTQRDTPASSSREDLVYGALFDFRTPEVLWQASDSRVRALLYRGVLEGHDACVTSGLTDPAMGPAAVSKPGRTFLGCGYELILLCRRDEPALWREFAGWARYVVEQGQHILRGNWLEYDQGQIPGTDLGGFLVVAPATFPESFPLGGGWGQWNLLLGATPLELQEAKRSSVLPVAQRLFESGYEDWSTSRRASVMSQ